MPQPLMTRPIARSTAPQEQTRWYNFKNKTDGDEKVAEVYIYDEIGGSWFGGVSAADFIKDLEKAEADDPDRFEVHINSPGGDVFDGVAIHSALKQLGQRKPVKVIIDSLAASAASFIAQAGTEVVMMRNATMMVHDASGMVWGTADAMRKQAGVLDQISNNIADIYHQSNGDLSVDEWREVMREEVWYNGTEAVAAGLATSVMADENKDADAKASAWNLSVYNYAGRDAAPAPSRVMQQARFSNQAKEQGMAKSTGVKAHDTSGEPAGATGDGETIPAGTELVDNPDTAGAEGAPASGEPATQQGAGSNGEQPVPAPGAGENPARHGGQASATNSTGLVPVVVNGVSHTVPAAVAAHITVLEATQRESVEAGKRTFIQSLVDSNKVTEPQKEGLEVFALGLSDEAYSQWKATWDLAPVQPVVGYRHGQSTHNSGSAGAVDASADRRAILEETVANLKRSGLNDAQLAKTKSYMELQQLNATANQA